MQPFQKGSPMLRFPAHGSHAARLSAHKNTRSGPSSAKVAAARKSRIVIYFLSKRINSRLDRHSRKG